MMDPTIEAPAHPVEWRSSDAPVGYEEAVTAMERRVAAIRAGAAPELVWLLEHPPLYTVGPELAHFRGIGPRGISDQGLTSLARLGTAARVADVDAALRATFDVAFGEALPAYAARSISAGQ